MQTGDYSPPPPNYAPPPPPISAKKIDVSKQLAPEVPDNRPTPPPRRTNVQVAQTANKLATNLPAQNQNPVTTPARRALPQRVRVGREGVNPKGTENLAPKKEHVAVTEDTSVAVKEDAPAVKGDVPAKEKKVAFRGLKAAGQAISAKFSSLKNRAVKLLPSRSKPPSSSTPLPGNIQQALSNSSVGKTKGPKLDSKTASHAALSQVENKLLKHLREKCVSDPAQFMIGEGHGNKFGRTTNLSDKTEGLKKELLGKDFTANGAVGDALNKIELTLSGADVDPNKPEDKAIEPTEILALGKKLAADRPCFSNSMRNDLMKDFKNYGQARLEHKNLSTVPKELEDQILEKSGIKPLRDSLKNLTKEANDYLFVKKRELGDQFYGKGEYANHYNNNIQPLIGSNSSKKISKMNSIVKKLPQSEIARMDDLIKTISAIKVANGLNGATQQESVGYTGIMMMFRPFFFKDGDLYEGKSSQEKTAIGYTMDGAMEFLVNNWDSIKPKS